jgi:3-methylcrotonyl-CoA carboxylase alpha subunit
VSTRLLESTDAIGRGTSEQELHDAWLIAVAARLQRHATAREAREATSPWEQSSGFRLNAAPAVRVALRLDPAGLGVGETRAQRWLAIETDGADMLIAIDGRPHRVSLQSAAAGIVSGHIDGREVTSRVEFDHDRTIVRFHCLQFEFSEDTGAEHRVSAEHEGHFRAPMPGHVLDVRVQAGQVVEQGTVLLVLEAMKMEHSLTAPWRARVAEIHVESGQRVEEGTDLVRLEPAP